ncbi:hypothetical protein [Sulfurimonas sp.]
MEIKNSTFSATSFYHSETNTQNKNTDNTTEKSINIEVDSTEIEYTKGYDLENITPHETYVLANELYKKGEISVWQLASMMIIGFKHEYSVTNKPLDLSLQNNRPFNLLQELKDTIAGKANPNFHPKILEEMPELIDILLSLPEESLKIKQSSIDISV